MSHLLKFGFHDFLNAQPLLKTLQEKTEEGCYELVLDYPASIAQMLNVGKLDLAMIPSIEYLKNENRYKLLSPLVIASKGPVETVLFITKKELNKIRSVALDKRSMTSATLLKLLFIDKFNPKVQFEILPPDPLAQLEIFDAVLVIGDNAFGVRHILNPYKIYDLSDLWYRETGKPFVHAVLVSHKEIKLPESLPKIFNEALNRVPETIATITEIYAKRLRLKPSQCADYLKNKIRYHLNPEIRSGLDEFQTLCLERRFIN